jgi:hypothetical protein
VEPQELTSAHCREVAHHLRTRLDALDVKLSASSPLAALLTDVEWLASFEGPTLDGVSGASSEDPDRAAGAVLRFLQVQDITAALVALGPRARANPEALSALRKRFDRIETQEAATQDRLFELEVAGRLARRGIWVEFGEPDVVARSTGLGRFCLACKRPQNVDRLRERIREGADQIARRGLRGFVVADLQALIFKNDDDVRRTRFYELHGAAQLAQELAANMDGWIAVVADAVARARRVDRVAGVVFATMGWGETKNPPRPTYDWAWVTRPSIPSTAAERRLCRLLGGANLK